MVTCCHVTVPVGQLSSGLVIWKVGCLFSAYRFFQTVATILTVCIKKFGTLFLTVLCLDKHHLFFTCFSLSNVDK